jgi:hydroxymethylbilane synthase
MSLIFATRPSLLARAQTQLVIDGLQRAWPEVQFGMQVITSQGDRNQTQPLPEIGGKGLFTHDLADAILSGEVQAAVHSYKDLPVEDSPGLATLAVLERGEARDMLISTLGCGLFDLPEGTVVGTSSLRRKAQLLAARPDLQVVPMRGNVDTRLMKLERGDVQALVLAAAGLDRLDRTPSGCALLSIDEMLPAPAQGALAVQCCAGDAQMLATLDPILNPRLSAAVGAERAFLTGLGGGCAVPVAAYACWEEETLSMQGLVASVDGKEVLRVRGRGTDPFSLAKTLVQEILGMGASRLLKPTW